MLDYYGQSPIIVRSSSLLEDSFGNAFAGKYLSVFCANQGDPDTRLVEFMRAVKLVYASALNPDALSYRASGGLGENDEQMAILVQRVSGMPYQQYFLPVPSPGSPSRAISIRWNDRIDPRQGIIRLVFGLGTRRWSGSVRRLSPHDRHQPSPIAAGSGRQDRQVLPTRDGLLTCEATAYYPAGCLFNVLERSPDFPNLLCSLSVVRTITLTTPVSKN